MKKQDLIMCIMVMIAVMMVTFVISQKLDCDDMGGVFVRTFSWFECVFVKKG